MVAERMRAFMERGLAGDLASLLAQRYSYYDLLRRIFLWQMPQGLFAELVEAAKREQDDDDSVSSHDAALRSVLKQVAASDVPAVYRDIQIEYTRLFLGPRHLPAPPYESVYRSPQKLMMQDVTMDVRAFYRNNGFCVAQFGQEPDDCIGIELEFMCALSKQSVQALTSQDCDQLATLVSAQHEFCELHLSRWVPQFCGDIVRDTKSEFWKAMAVFTQSFLAQDSADLNQLMHQLEVPAEPRAANQD